MGALTTYMAHASLVELLQATVAMLGVVAASWQLWDSLRDAAMTLTQRDRRQKSRSILATDNVRADVVRVLGLSTILGIGLVSLFLPPPPEYGVQRLTPEQVERFQVLLRFIGLQPLLTRIGLILVTLLWTIDGLAARYARRRYLAELRTVSADDTTKLARIEDVSVDTNVRVHAIEDKVNDLPKNLKGSPDNDHE